MTEINFELFLLFQDVWKIPTSIKSIDAVCLLENYMTALIGLEQYGGIVEEDMVLVNVGIGGIGLAAVDIASNIYRAKVLLFIFLIYKSVENEFKF